MKHKILFNPVLIFSLILASGIALANPFAVSASPSASMQHTDTIAVGWTHTCILTGTGGVKCWGQNPHGNLGDGTMTDRSTPIAVIGLSSGVIDITAGFHTTCALTNTGVVKCWGWNHYGQLGDGTTANRSTPVDVVGLTDVVDIMAYDSNVCALTKAGGVKCWGRNESGQLGDGTNIERHAPVDVIGLTSGVTAMSTAAVHTPCAVMEAGGLKCWGWNNYGQVGDGTLIDRNTPVDVPGLSSNVVATTGGLYHTCALLESGIVQCWGKNGLGELGDGTNIDRLSPGNVSGINDAIAISSRQSHVCILTRAGGVKCWGSNYAGSLGDGTTIDRNIPVDVVGLAGGVASVAAGTHTCARMINGGVKCWGVNWYGQIGDGTLTDRFTPVDVNGILPPPAIMTSNISTPGNPNIYPGDTVLMELPGYDTDGIYGIQTACAIDPDILGLQGAEFGGIFDPTDRLLGANSVDSTNGTWFGAISQQNPAAPLSGDGLYATLTLTAINPGATTLNCAPLAANRDGFKLPITFVGTQITVITFGIGDGVARYQGRTNYSGIQVTATGPVTQTVFTDSAGTFALDRLKAGSYLIKADAALYLPACASDIAVTSGQTVSLEAATLLGGDLNDDEMINIGDVSRIGTGFGTSDSGADINADGTVNVQDLALIGGNYEIAGCQDW